MARDTTTGNHFEAIVATCLARSAEKNGFEYRSQKFIGIKPGGGRHKIDWELVDIQDPDIRGLISCKVQNTSGSADEKVAYEVIKLLHAMIDDDRYKKSWLILGGNHWRPEMRDFLEVQMPKYVPLMNELRFKVLYTDDLISSDLKLRN